MKKAFLLSFLFFAAMIPFTSKGQWAPFNNPINFDAGDTLWPHAILIDTVHYHHNQWQVGRPHKVVFDSAFSPLNAIVTDTIHPYAPNDTSVFVVTFPGHASGWWFQNFSFYYKLNMDSTSLARIDYSPDSGRTWINIHDSTPVGFGFIPPFTLSNTTGWSSIGFMTASGPDGSYYHNDSVKFKFTFIAGSDTMGKDGWMIDNINVLYEMEGVPNLNGKEIVSLFPNPATNELTINYAGAISGKSEMEIYDMTGRLVHAFALTTNKTTLSIADLAPGLYECRISGYSNGIITKKLVVGK